VAKISFASTLPAALKGKSVVAFVASQKAVRGGAWKHVFAAGQHGLIRSMVDKIDAGTLGKAVTSYTGGKTPKRVSVAALPDAPSRHAAPSRSDAAGACAAKLGVSGDVKAAVVLCLDEPAHYLPLANAIARAFPLFRDVQKAPKQPQITFVAVDAKGKAIKPAAGLAATVDATRWAASLVDTPTADMTTADFVSAARKGLRGLKGVKISTIVGNDLLKKKMGGIHAVGRTAMVPPRLLILEHGTKAKGKKTVALVGKGDTGGLSLKPSASMSGMKCDMGGGAAVLGAFRALVASKCPHRVVALVPLAENAIGPNSYRPDDILHMHSGKRVEINNTDAEGRLLLADAVSYAARVIKADVIMDAATLTGAQLLATGKRHAAVVSNREGLEGLAVEAGRRSGDLTHPLPFAPEFFQAEFKSEVADMRNSVKDRYNAQSSCAGQFVYSHIQELNVPWLHIDLAGPAFPGKRATGFGVALMRDVAMHVTAGALKR
jgi:probable aminopeptidase NPEPL1